MVLSECSSLICYCLWLLLHYRQPDDMTQNLTYLLTGPLKKKSDNHCFNCSFLWICRLRKPYWARMTSVGQLCFLREGLLVGWNGSAALVFILGFPWKEKTPGKTSSHGKRGDTRGQMGILHGQAQSQSKERLRWRMTRLQMLQEMRNQGQ